MEEAEEEPFWLTDDLRRSGRRRRGSPANLLMSSGVMLVILVVVAGVFVFVIVPSILRFGSQIFKPHLVKKSWDSLNLVLVAFAIVCGFLSRNSDGGSRDLDRRVERPSEPTAEGGDRDRWYGGFDRTVEDRDRRVSGDLVAEPSESTVEGRDRWYGGFDRTVEALGSRYLTRMRSTRSYSDLGLVEPTDRWRFHDDTDLRNRRVFGSGQYWVGGGERKGREDPETRNVVAESFVANDIKTASFTPPVPQSERAYQVAESVVARSNETTSLERAYQSVPLKKRSEDQNFEKLRPSSPPYPAAAIPAPRRSSQPVRQRSRSEDLEMGRYLGARNLEDLRPPSPPPETAETPVGAYQTVHQRSRSEDLDNVGRYVGLGNFEELLPPSPPRAPAGKAAKLKKIRGKQAVVEETLDFVSSTSHAPPPAPPYPTAENSGAIAKRRGGGTKDLWIALRRRKKKKKQRERSVEDLASFFSSHEPPHAPPPPPPPPPPSSVFYNLFSPRKSSKTKKSTSVPPPPPQTAAREPKPQTRTLISHAQAQSIHASTTRKPPSPARTTTTTTAFVDLSSILNSGNISPVIPIPPPPPPPFTIGAWRFRRQGDFVRINSDTSSRSASPELEDVEYSPTATETDGGEAAAALFCPSPDVDTKADSFIARFRAGLNLEKMNSIRRSNLGPGPDPGPSFQ